MRFRRSPRRPHEIERIPDVPQIGHVVVALTILPPERLPDGVGFDEIMQQVTDAVREPVEDWYRAGGHRLLMCAPDVV